MNAIKQEAIRAVEEATKDAEFVLEISQIQDVDKVTREQKDKVYYIYHRYMLLPSYVQCDMFSQVYTSVFENILQSAIDSGVTVKLAR